MDKKYTVLIVEDSPEDQATYQRYLSKTSGNSILTASEASGLKGLAYLNKNKADCILLDYQLPDMSGLEFIKRLQNDNSSHIPIVMLTGQGNEKIAVEALKLGASDYLMKGDLQATQLHETILNAIEKSAQQEKLDQQQAENEFMAYHDPLTGLANRRQFEELAQHALLRAKRFQTQLAIFMLDLDGFKQINDKQGHPAGDLVLQEVSHRFSDALRKNDVLGRLGGDEFSILLEDIVSAEALEPIAQKLIKSLEKPIRLSGGEVRISVSIGIALHPKDGEDIALLMKRADNALYEAKQSGKQTFRFAKTA